ncbi:MAG: PEP-CTERM sorting domain-containing protein [Limisphaerales bacterium]
MGTIGQSAWQFISTDLSAFAGQTVTLSFTVDNNGDSDFLLDSQLAIDNLQLAPVPEPATGALLAGGLGLVVLLRLRRRNS